MNANRNSLFSMNAGAGELAPASNENARASGEVEPRAITTAERQQRRGKKMIFGGFTIIVVGIVLYCAVCFAGGIDADLANILLDNAVPLGRGALAILGVGIVVWLVGSFTYLKGAMDADDAATPKSDERKAPSATRAVVDKAL